MKLNQKQIIANHLKNHGRITSIEAIDKYRITRLAAVIFDLKDDGYKIYSERCTSESNKNFARYHLVKSPA